MPVTAKHLVSTVGWLHMLSNIGTKKSHQILKRWGEVATRFFTVIQDYTSNGSGAQGLTYPPKMLRNAS